MIYDWREVPSDYKPIWGCAYTKGYNEKSTMLLKKPVKGVIISNYFYELGKNGKAKKSPCVNVYSRTYADTYEESVQAYDDQVHLQIQKLRDMIWDCKQDLINTDLEGDINE